MTLANSAPARDTTNDSRQGAIYAALAFVLWGFNPAFFKFLAHVPADQILAYRIIWAVAFTAILVSVGRRWRTVSRVLRAPRLWLMLLVSATLLSGNWLVYIWAVNSGQVLETSLGYFINPLLSVVLGMVMLRERLSRLQAVAVVLAAVAVLILTLSFGRLPWISLWLAGTFGIYGYLRKIIMVESLDGLFVETLLMLPVAIGYLLWLGGAAAYTPAVDADLFLMILTGVITALPLLWFAAAARRLQLSTVGLFQYIAPSMQFLLAVFVYGEAFTGTHMVTFGLIWLALALYSRDSIMSTRAIRATKPAD
jgi:chloramphenicol-sensitive protein RarD